MSQSKDITETTQDEVSGPIMDGDMIEGVFLPKLFESNRPMKEHIELLKSLEMRDDDVVLMTYAKTGTHWMWEIASMLVCGKAEYEKRAKETVMMEAVSIESMQSEPSPRVFNTHLPFHLLPRQILEKKVKVIHVYRNVKDVFVSMYFHFRQAPELADHAINSFEKLFFSKWLPTGTYVDYMKQMHEYLEKHPDLPVFTTSFEDMKEDPEKVVKNLAEFLGVKASPQLCKDIAEATSFAKLKKADETKQQSTNLPPTSFYRKGMVRTDPLTTLKVLLTTGKTATRDSRCQVPCQPLSRIRKP